MRRANWYKDFGITVFKSMRRDETYTTVDGFKIVESSGSEMDKVKESGIDYEVIVHIAFGFLLTEWIESAKLNRCLQNIEKLYLLHKLDARPFFPWVRLICSEGAEFSIVTKEFIEDLASLTLGEQLKKETKGKEIFFFDRIKWEIRQREPLYSGDVIIKVRAKFNFLVLDKK